MKPQVSTQYDSFDDPLVDAEGLEETSEDDLWVLPGPMEVEPDYLPPGPRAELRETAVLDDWRKAEAGNAARLARVAGRIGALDDRLHRGPEGWRHRLALMEAAARLGGSVLQPARHRRATYQGRQVCVQLEAAFMQAVPRQRGAAATALAGLQPGHLPALHRAAGGDG